MDFLRRGILASRPRRLYVARSRAGGPGTGPTRTNTPRERRPHTHHPCMMGNPAPIMQPPTTSPAREGGALVNPGHTPNTQEGTPPHNDKPVSPGEETTTTEKTTTSQLVRLTQEGEREKEHAER